MDRYDNKNTSPHLITLLRFWLIGFIFFEIWLFSNLIGLRLSEFIEKNNYKALAVVVGLSYLLVIIIYLLCRKISSDIQKLIRSKRVDLLLLFIVGYISDFYIGGLQWTYKSRLSILTDKQLLIILSIPLFLYISFLFNILKTWFRNKRDKITPFFVSDNEQKTKKNDLLGFSDIADKFAERVINQGSSDSVVFGVDAPWGIGKSSFVNFCREYWREKHNNRVIVYMFNPLKYEDRENLLEKFIDGLIKEIQKNLFIPEIRPVMSTYAKMIRSIKGNFLGLFNFEVVNNKYSIEDAFNDLEFTLSNIDQKIIIVIDDLDRLNLSAVKDLLFTIKKSFTLPNISYVLCYDAENINALERKKPDFEKVTEFLEKFVNVKVSLYLNSNKLIEYTSKNLEKSLSGNSQANPLLVSKAIGGLKELFLSNEYHSYVQFIGDIRKIKRLINTILLLDIEKMDFDNSDINSYDLIHLLLIYINYPNVFRKIYNTETGGKKGFFSLVSQYEDGYPKDKNVPHVRDSEYKNSIIYSKYLKSPLLTDGQKFLLNKIFNVDQRIDGPNVSNISPELRSTLACFNGDIWSSGNRNLEDYLNLIVSSSKPLKDNQYKFYLNQKEELIKGVSIKHILRNKVFSSKQNELSHKQLWKVIINSGFEFNKQIGDQLISYLVNNITLYSHFRHEESGFGLRHDLSFYLVKIIDQAGWVDENGEHKNNFDENLSGIVDWIFGKGEHSEEGILSSLSEEKRGILGFYDLLSFRIHCSADRGGDLFNISRALSKYDGPNAPISGPTKEIAIDEMRIISQKAFQIFKEQYINKKKNIFDLIDSLTLEKLAGQYKKIILEKIKKGEIENTKKIISETKSKIKAFVVYQLGSQSIDFGVACGFYDPSGRADKHTIATKINEYLFEVCFYPGKSKDNHKNYEHFLDYLLINFSSIFESVKGRKYIPSINEFTKVLDEEKIYKYWKNNSSLIKSLNFEKKNKIIYASNYTTSYKEDLLEVYKVLDSLVEKKEKPDSH